MIQITLKSSYTHFLNNYLKSFAELQFCSNKSYKLLIYSIRQRCHDVIFSILNINDFLMTTLIFYLYFNQSSY